MLVLFKIFVFILMAIRFAEVYISSLYGMKEKTNTTLGGFFGCEPASASASESIFIL